MALKLRSSNKDASKNLTQHILVKQIFFPLFAIGLLLIRIQLIEHANTFSSIESSPFNSIYVDSIICATDGSNAGQPPTYCQHWLPVRPAHPLLAVPTAIHYNRWSFVVVGNAGLNLDPIVGSSAAIPVSG